jgi:SAM-dependent methyltransferase
MYQWSDQRIEWYQRAVAYHRFDRALADAVAPALRREETVCDLGCGTGYLAMELARRGFAVTAFDQNDQTVAYLRAEALRRGLGTLTVEQGSWFDLPHQPRWDTVVMVFAGHLDIDLPLFLSLCRRQLILVLKDGDQSHVQADGVSPILHVTPRQVEAQLDGFRWHSRALTTQFGQPLRSEEEALEYLRAFHADTETAESALHRLERTDDPDYPLHLPNEKRMALYFIEKEGTAL